MTEEDKPPEPTPTLHTKPNHPTATDTSQTEHLELIALESWQLSDTLIPDPTPTEPSIMHIFDNA